MPPRSWNSRVCKDLGSKQTLVLGDSVRFLIIYARYRFGKDDSVKGVQYAV